MKNYFQNSQMSVTKEVYFEMCEQMGTEPVEEDIPVEYEDFPVELQQSFSIYNVLQDNWDTMNGNYMGKYLDSVPAMFEVFEIPHNQKIFYLDLIKLIDSVRSEELNRKKNSS